MAIDQKAFFAESKRLQEQFGMTRDQADMHAAEKFWEGIVDEKMQPTEGEVVSRRPNEQHTYPNGKPMFAPDGMMLDDQGNGSIFDDVDE